MTINLLFRLICIMTLILPAACRNADTQSTDNRTASNPPLTKQPKTAVEGMLKSPDETAKNSEPNTSESDAVKDQDPKTTESKELGILQVHADKLEVSNNIAARDDSLITIEIAAKPQHEAVIVATTIPLSEISDTQLTPNTEYVVTVVANVPSGDQEVIEELPVTTLAQEPTVQDVLEYDEGQLHVLIETESNPPETQYTIAVIDTFRGDIVSYINPESGLPVGENENKWSALPASEDSLTEDAVVVIEVTTLELPSQSIAIAVQAQNTEGIVTPLSEGMSPERTQLADSSEPIGSQIDSHTEEIRELRERLAKLKAERKELKILDKEQKKMRPSKGADSDKHEKKFPKKSDLKKNLDELKTEIRSLKKLLSSRLSQLKIMKKRKKLDKPDHKNKI